MRWNTKLCTLLLFPAGLLLGTSQASAMLHGGAGGIHLGGGGHYSGGGGGNNSSHHSGGWGGSNVGGMSGYSSNRNGGFSGNNQYFTQPQQPYNTYQQPQRNVYQQPQRNAYQQPQYQQPQYRQQYQQPQPRANQQVQRGNNPRPGMTSPGYAGSNTAAVGKPAGGATTAKTNTAGQSSVARPTTLGQNSSSKPGKLSLGQSANTPGPAGNSRPALPNKPANLIGSNAGTTSVGANAGKTALGASSSAKPAGSGTGQSNPVLSGNLTNPAAAGLASSTKPANALQKQVVNRPILRSNGKQTASSIDRQATQAARNSAYHKLNGEQQQQVQAQVSKNKAAAQNAKKPASVASGSNRANGKLTPAARSGAKLLPANDGGTAALNQIMNPQSPGSNAALAQAATDMKVGNVLSPQDISAVQAALANPNSGLSVSEQTVLRNGLNNNLSRQVALSGLGGNGILAASTAGSGSGSGSAGANGGGPGGLLGAGLAVVNGLAGSGLGVPADMGDGSGVFMASDPTAFMAGGGDFGGASGYFASVTPAYADPSGDVSYVAQDVPGYTSAYASQDQSKAFVAPPAPQPAVDGNGQNSAVLTSDPPSGSNASPVKLCSASTPLTAVYQHTRYLRVANLTSGKINLRLQYYTLDTDGNWAWSPADPTSSSDAMSWTLDPKEDTFLAEGGWQINASRVRIWFQSEESGQNWTAFQNRDLVLVPETDENGVPTYLATNVETFNLCVK